MVNVMSFKLDFVAVHQGILLSVKDTCGGFMVPTFGTALCRKLTYDAYVGSSLGFGTEPVSCLLKLGAV